MHYIINFVITFTISLVGFVAIQNLFNDFVVAFLGALIIAALTTYKE